MSRMIMLGNLLVAVAFAAVLYAETPEPGIPEDQCLLDENLRIFRLREYVYKDDGSGFLDERGIDGHPLNGPDAEEQRVLDQVFDLSKPAVARYLVRLMNMHPVPGTVAMKCRSAGEVILGKKQEGFLWLVENYDDLSASGREHAMRCLRAFESRESVLVLAMMLGDRTTVDWPLLSPEEKSQVLPVVAAWPKKVLPEIPYLRICDHACNALKTTAMSFIYQGEANDLVGTVLITDTYEERDRLTAIFRTWLESADAQKFLLAKYSMLADEKLDPSFRRRLGGDMEALRMKIARCVPPKPHVKYVEEETPDVEQEAKKAEEKANRQKGMR
jgi:hypothetical protein